MNTPLFVTADESLLEELLRLAAAAGVTPEIARDPALALRSWASASLVLVGSDAAPEMARLRPLRRPRVHVVSLNDLPDAMFRTAVDLGAESVAGLPRSETWVVESLTDLGETGTTQGRVIGVLGGSGGAGATTLAAALGQIGARSGESVVIDCDPYGPGIDRILGLENREGFRWDALGETTGRLSARSLRDAVPRRDRLGVLSWPPGNPRSLQAFAAREAISAARRGHDTVVLDLPRTPSELIDEVSARCDALLVVVVPTVAGLASAARTCTRFTDLPGLRLVVRGDGLSAREVGAAVGVPVLCTMGEQRHLAESLDLGVGPVRSMRGPLARAGVEILDAVGAVLDAA